MIPDAIGTYFNNGYFGIESEQKITNSGLFKTITRAFKAKIEGKAADVQGYESDYKFLLFAAHDTNFSGIMKALGLPIPGVVPVSA